MSGPVKTKPMYALRFAALCEGMAACLILTILPLYVRNELGEESYLVVMFNLSLPALPIFLANNFWGAFVDTTGGFRLAERVGLLGFAFCLTALCAVSTSTGAILVVVGFSVLYGAVRPTLLSHATLIKERAKGRALASILLFESAGWFLAGITFFLLYGRDAESAPRTIWAIFGAAAFISLATALLFPRWVRNPDIGRATASFGTVLKQGVFKVLLGDLGRIYRNPDLFRLGIVVFFTSTANWAFFGMYPLIFTEMVEGSKNDVGLSISASTVTAMIVFSFIGRIIDRRGGRAGLLTALVLYIAVYMSMYFCNSSWQVFALFVIPVYPIFLVSSSALAAEATRSDERAGGLGVLAGVFAFSVLTGSSLGGLIGDAFELRTVILTATVFSCLGLAAFMVLVGFRRRAPKFEERTL